MNVICIVEDKHWEKHKRILGKKTPLRRRMFYRVLDVLERWAGRFITFHLRPIRARQVGVARPVRPDYSAFAVVMQGPLIREYDFTLETLALYRTYYPGATLILSTWEWEDGDRAALAAARREGVVVIVNEKKDFPNVKKQITNLNLQILSSAAGVAAAEERGAAWALKTRTDQRMYCRGALDFFANLAELFPVARCGASVQKKRLVSLDRGKSRPRPYHLVDWLLFGTVEDMAAYWGADLITEPPERLRSCEAYLFAEFLKKIGHRVVGTIEDSLAAFAEHCVIINPDLVDFYWRKYEYHRERRLVNYYTSKPRNFGFAEWLEEYKKIKKPK